MKERYAKHIFEWRVTFFKTVAQHGCGLAVSGPTVRYPVPFFRQLGFLVKGVTQNWPNRTKQ